MRRRPSPDALAADLLAGDRRALGRAITLVESERPADRPAARTLLAAVRAGTSGAPTLRVGITGTPGVGKSTFIEAVGSAWLAAGHRLAVLAIDPSSSRTRGSILGDKTRMPTLAADARAYIRPSPAGRTLGGVARATRGALALCEAAGYDRVVVETVGVGQSETTVRLLCDFMALLVLPGGGDELQGIKRGIVELTDLVVVHKADGPRERQARETAADYRRALHLQPARTDGWTPRAITASSVVAGGLDGVGESLAAYVDALGPDQLAALRGRQAVGAFELAWGEEVLSKLQARPAVRAELDRQRAALAANAQTVEGALDEVLANVLAR